MSLQVLGAAGRDKGHRLQVRCRCVCGAEFVTDDYKVRSGHTKSCGCLKPSLLRAARLKHDESRPHTPEYRAWSLMKNRCLNANDERFADYGGRGISVCPLWMASYEAFLADMGRRPSAEHSLDRINNDGNYEPSNCRWATRKQQRNNQRRCKKEPA